MDNNSSYQEVYAGRKIVEHTIDQLTFVRIIFGNLSDSGGRPHMCTLRTGDEGLMIR